MQKMKQLEGVIEKACLLLANSKALNVIEKACLLLANSKALNVPFFVP